MESENDYTKRDNTRIRQEIDNKAGGQIAITTRGNIRNRQNQAVLSTRECRNNRRKE